MTPHDYALLLPPSQRAAFLERALDAGPPWEPQPRWAARYMHVDYPGETRDEAIAAVREEYDGPLDVEVVEWPVWVDGKVVDAGTARELVEVRDA